MAFYSHQPPFQVTLSSTYDLDCPPSSSPYPQLYAYAPMAIPNQEFYAVHPYHPGHPGLFTSKMNAGHKNQQLLINSNMGSTGMGSPLEHGQYFYEPPHKAHMGQNQGRCLIFPTWLVPALDS